MGQKILKGFYFSQVEAAGLGPRRKIQGQIKTFREKGIALELVESPFCLTGVIRGNFLLRQLVCRLPFTFVYSKHQYKAVYDGADVFYVRFIAGDRAFIRFLRQLRKRNPHAKIIMELADYPTTWYMTTSFLYTVLYFPIILKDWWAGRQYKKYVDRIVMPQKRQQAFGIPVIPFENGIIVNDIAMRVPEETQIIRIIAVAGMCNFHGYDRLIEGLHSYYSDGGKRQVELHMVGGKAEPGNELMRYQELVQRYSLEERVFFYGERRGADLDAVYNKCNLAVASLGMYRIGYQTANSLKVREYLAKGLPVITGSKVDLFENEDFPYYLEFPNDDSDIDISQIIDFYDKIYGKQSSQELNHMIREFALERCDMSRALRPVIEYMLSTKRENN